MSKITITGPEDLFSDAAQPMLKICDELERFGKVQKEIDQARALINEARQILDDAFCKLR